MIYCILNFLLFFFSLFTYFDDEVSAIKKQLMETYQKHEAEKHMGLKSYSLEITDNGFLRYKKTQNNNKSELYSVKLNKVKDVDFYGTEQSGWFLFQCEPEAVIYQSRRDPKGNIDSMANEICFPLSGISVEELNLFKENFNKLKVKVEKGVMN